MVRLTLLSHMRNEELLLPMWLTYHKTIFDHGIIVDYDSTDRSQDIIKQICPTWEVKPTTVRDANGVAQFIPRYTDREMMEIEKAIDGFKQILNTTEFFVVTDPNFRDTLKRNVAYRPSGWDLIGRQPADPTNILELLDSVSCVRHDPGRGRYFHDLKPASYRIGRHFLNTRRALIKSHPSMHVFHLCTPFPYSERFYERALRVKDLLPIIHEGRVTGGSQHFRSRKAFEDEAAEQMRQATNRPIVWETIPEPNTPEYALHYWRALVTPK